MRIFCLEDFKVEFEKLISKNSYKSIQRLVIDHFFDKFVDELKQGTRLNNSDETPYIKKRLGGRGGFRCYFLLILKDECLYLMYIHPKTGKYGARNLTKESINSLNKKVLESIKNSDLYELNLDEDKENIEFTYL